MDQLFLTSIIMGFIMIAFLFHRKFKGTVFSSKVYYFIWIIIAIRLVLPFDISIKNPVYQVSSTLQSPIYTNNQAAPADANINDPSNKSPLIIENNTSPSPASNNNNLSIWILLQENIFNIWLAGALTYLLYHLLLYGFFRKRINKSFVPAEGLFKQKLSDLKSEMGISKDLQLRKSHLIDSPMIAGLIKPVLILPSNVDFQHVDHIFRHELIHLKRNDITYKGIIFMATAIHWFNPLVHLMLKIAGQDLELSCDEEVVGGMSKKEKTVYCKTLIKSLARKRMPLYTTQFSGGKKMIQKRIDVILDSANKKIPRSFILLLILFVFTTSLLIGCSENQEVQEESQADILYDYKTPYIGDNSKVGNILSNLDFPEGYSYESMALFTDAQPYKLQVNCITHKGSDFPRSKFEFLSAVIFSLIGNLDEIQYTPKDEENYSQPAHIMSRQEIDNITLSVTGSHTQEIGNDQDKFQNLLKLYENHSGQADDTGSDGPPSSPIDTSDLFSSSHENINDLKDVNMTVKAGSIQKKGLSLLFENKTNKTIIYSDDFMLEQKIDEVWYEVPVTIEGNYGFHDIAYEVLSNQVREFTVDWEWLYGILEPGDYRIIKSILDFREPGDFDSYYLSAEFKISS